jgi:hypothetical protein
MTSGGNQFTGRICRAGAAERVVCRYHEPSESDEPGGSSDTAGRAPRQEGVLLSRVSPSTRGACLPVGRRSRSGSADDQGARRATFVVEWSLEAVEVTSVSEPPGPTASRAVSGLLVALPDGRCPACVTTRPEAGADGVGLCPTCGSAVEISGSEAPARRPAPVGLELVVDLRDAVGDAAETGRAGTGRANSAG